MKRISFLLGLGVLVATAQAEVTDLTDPAHPQLISSNDFAGETPPGFDCQKASTRDEKLICNSEPLIALDQTIGSLYFGLAHCLPKEEALPLRDAQRQWIKDRAACAAKGKDDEAAIACMQAVYQTRIQQLQTRNIPCEERESVGQRNESFRYRNKKYGFEITFPKSMSVTSTFTGRSLVTQDAWTLGYNNPANPNDKGIPVVALVAPLLRSDVEVRIGVRPGKTSEDACGWPSGVATTLINGRHFRSSSPTLEDHPTSVKNESYQTYAHGLCYSVDRFIFRSNTVEVGEEKEKKREDDDAESYYKKTKQIVDSFTLMEK